MRVRPLEILTLLGALLLAVNAHAQSAPADLSPAEVFQALYEHVTSEVEGGRLTPEVGQQARELWIGFRKAVIESDAELEILKLEASSSQGSRQAEALEALVEATAARERLLIGYVRRLEGLSGVSAKSVAATVVDEAAEEAPTPEGEGEAEEDPEKGKKKRLQIDFEPEDLINTPQWMG
jgi:hypothetical protein